MSTTSGAETVEVNGEVSTTNNEQTNAADNERRATNLWRALRSRRVLRSATWAVTAVLSGLIGLVLNDMWNAPRPHVEVAAVQLRSFGDGKARVDVPFELRGRMKVHAYFDDPSASTTPEEIDGLITKARQWDATYQRQIARIDEMLELLRTTATTIDITERRQQLLSKWHEGGQGESLSMFAKSVLGAREAKLPAKYRNRTTAGQLWVELGPGHIVSLREEDEDEMARSESAVRGAMNVYDRVWRETHNANLLTRMFTFMEPEIISDVLRESKARMSHFVSDSQKIATELRALAQKVQPERLVASITITNAGGKPLAVRNVGILFLKLPAAADGKAHTLPINLATDASSPITIVEPGAVKVIELRSDLTADELVNKHEPLRQPNSEASDGDTGGSRLKLLFKSSAISAAVALARAGAPVDRASIGASDYHAVGAKGDDLILEQLRASMINQ